MLSCSIPNPGCTTIQRSANDSLYHVSNFNFNSNPRERVIACRSSGAALQANLVISIVLVVSLCLLERSCSVAIRDDDEGTESQNDDAERDDDNTINSCASECHATVLVVEITFVVLPLKSRSIIIDN